MAEPLFLAIDQGTSGSTALVVDGTGMVRSRGYCEVAVDYPRPGWVEQDPEQLWQSVLRAAQAAVSEVDESQLVAVGITNQRETVVVFERATLKPLAPAIVWQCRRSADICAEHRSRGEEQLVRAHTGLLLDPYFSATKIEWLLRQDPLLRQRAQRGEICASTIDGWLLARMSAGKQLAIEASNASRTLLYDLHAGSFSPQLCALFDIPSSLLPDVVDSAAETGRTDRESFLNLSLPITGVAGDQQAALFGQACLHKGMSKNTYGTGSFLLVNVGTELPEVAEGLLTTVAWRLQGKSTYALEGSIFSTGNTIKWLRDSLHLIDSVEETTSHFEAVPDTAGCYFVPAFSGLGSPYWDAQARGAISGLSGAVGKAHVVRAAVEAAAFQTRDVVEAMERAADIAFNELRVDGGLSVVDGLCQFQADQLGIPVARAASAEATAVGAAMLAAVGAGELDLETISRNWRAGKRFLPAVPGHREEERYAQWQAAVANVRSHRGAAEAIPTRP